MWYENGVLSYTSFYKNGKIEGAAASFHENGNLRWTGYFKNNNLDGPFVKYDKEGKEISREYYSSKQEKKVSKKEWLKELLEDSDDAKENQEKSRVSPE